MDTPLSDNRFYGRRKGKPLSQYRQRLFESVLPALQPENWHKTFTNLSFKQIALEIGFGKGEHLLYQAQKNPTTLFIGCDPFINSVGTVLKEIDQQKLLNIYLWVDDVRLLLKELPLTILDEVFILFPDPWPKKRHHKRRLLQENFLNMLIPYLKPKAILNIATDHSCYAAQIETVFSKHPSFETVAGFPSFLRPDPEQPLTNYESKALKKLLNSSDNLSLIDSEQGIPRYFKFRSLF